MFFPNTTTPPALPPASITATSPFTPLHWLCPTCTTPAPIATATCPLPSCCAQPLTRRSALLDRRARPLNPSPFPVHWLCGTCRAPHPVLSILLRAPGCACGRPALRAVYDQFGQLFLFWPDDEGVRDLREGGAVAEAGRRLWAAGGGRWADEMRVVRMGEVEVGEKAVGGMML